MNDIFQSLDIQRDDILARIAQKLQLDSTRKERMESAYKSLGTLLNEDQGFFKGMEIEIYPQGSYPIGTTVRPLRGEEFDLDIVLHIKKPYHYFNPGDIYNELLKKLLSDGRYKQMVKRKRRCIRLEYTGDFHMDILPGCIVVYTDEKNLKVPDRELRAWSDTNPKGYMEWFLAIVNLVEMGLLENYYNRLYSQKALVIELPEDDFFKKKPLQTGLQLIKRYRDIYFEDKPEYATSSIILTTLAAHYYNRSNSIYITIDQILQSIKQEIMAARNRNTRLKILNPVNSLEDFSEKWDNDPQFYQHFQEFVYDFYTKWQFLKKDFAQSAGTYDELFGEGLYKTSIKNQVEKLGKYATDPLVSASALILNGKAHTDRKGNINEYEGTRNERHRDFGDK